MNNASTADIKITFVITGLDTGGAETMLYRLLEHNDVFAQGRVISLRPDGEMSERFRGLDVRVDSLEMNRGIPNPRAVLRLTSMLRKDKPSLLSTWMYHADLLGGFAAKMAGVPVVWGIHHSDLTRHGIKSSTRLVVAACARLSRSLPEAIACCSARARDVHVRAGYAADRFELIPNGFDTKRFMPDEGARMSVRNELGLPVDTRLVGMVGRFHPIKNHEGFIKAAGQVAGNRDDVHFLLAGRGLTDDNRTLQRWIDQADLTGRVHAIGLREDIARITASLDVAASSSHGEAFPNTLGEAMACQVPCISTDVGDAALIIGDTGTVVPQDDMTSLAQAIGRILDMPVANRQRLGEKARRRVADHFDITAVARRYEALFRGVIDRRRDRRA